MIQTEHRLNVTQLFYPEGIAPPDTVLTLKEIDEAIERQFINDCPEDVQKFSEWQMVEMQTIHASAAVFMYSTSMPPSLMYDLCRKAAISFHGKFGTIPEFNMVTAEFRIDEINLVQQEEVTND